MSIMCCFEFVCRQEDSGELRTVVCLIFLAELGLVCFNEPIFYQARVFISSLLCVVDVV